MLLTRKCVIYDPDSEAILRHMSYSAAKLWNVGNYEKRNYRSLGMDGFPDWYDQKKRLKTHFFYKNLPSQTAQDVLQELHEAWKSFFKLKETGGIENPRPPRFKQKGMDLTFLQNGIVQAGGLIRLTIPRQLKEYLAKTGHGAKFIYLKAEPFSNIMIRQLRVKLLGNGKLQLLAVFQREEPAPLSDNGRYLSIDLGITNTFTCYDSTSGTAFLIKGYLELQQGYNKLIAHYQSICASQQHAAGVLYPKTSKRIQALYTKKNNAIKDFLHKVTRKIAGYCIQHRIHTVVIGDITGIRKDKTLGRQNNQPFHSFPYMKIYQMLEYKLALYGITLIKQPEAYSSQCAPTTCMVSKQYASKNKRRTRGLYQDGCMLYNADAVGAYNILRLYLQKTNKQIAVFRDLSTVRKVTV